ncbi:MAG TPA: hypothetical protein VF516_29300, partial [Kofleriaceae bacterium]
ILGAGPAHDSFHTIADYLDELCFGIHYQEEEPGFVDLFALMDPATGTGHPLLGPLRALEHLRARHLRRQMDTVSAAAFGAGAVAWWNSVLHMVPFGTNWSNPTENPLTGDEPGPVNPLLSGATRPRAIKEYGYAELKEGKAQTGFSEFDLTQAALARARMATPAETDTMLPFPVLLAIMKTEGVQQFGPLNRIVKNTTVRAGTVNWNGWRTPLTTANFVFGDDARRGRQLMLLWPYGLDHFSHYAGGDGIVPPRTFNDGLVDDLANTTPPISPILTMEPGEDPGRYISARVTSELVPTVAPLANVFIWKRARRVHWAILGLACGYFRLMEAQILAGKNGFVSPDPAYLTPPPSLAGKTPLDVEYRDYITYYAMIYLAYNAGASVWRPALATAEAGRGATPLGRRDFLFFRSNRELQGMVHCCHFMIALDAFLRIDYLDGKQPVDFAAASGYSGSVAGRAWGV